MKKSTLIVAALVMASTSAMASKARMTALGQNGDTGSDYISDTRDIYTNPSMMLEMGDFAAFEAGKTTPTAATVSKVNAEGGFTKSAGGMKYGLFLGRDTKLNRNITGDYTAAASTYLASNNTFDLMVAGDAGMKWGAGLQYGTAESKNNTTASTDDRKNAVMGINAGVTTDMFSANLNLDSSSATGDGTTADNKKTLTGTGLFGSYNLGDGKSVYLQYTANKITTKTGTTDVDRKENTTYVGFANVMKMDAANTFFYAIEYKMGSTDTGAATNSKTDTTMLPVTIGVETEATSWLVLRGSVKQNVFIDSSKVSETDSHATNTTVVSAGAGLKFGKLNLDGTLSGMDSNDTTNGNGEINANKLLANASLTYMF